MTVKTYRETDKGTRTPNPHTTLAWERTRRPQTPPAAHALTTEPVGVLSHLRNALGLVLVGVGVVGTLYLMFEHLAQ